MSTCGKQGFSSAFPLVHAMNQGGGVEKEPQDESEVETSCRAKEECRMKAHVRLFAVLLVVGVLAAAAAGKDAPQPAGDVILTVSGAIALTNGDGVFAMDEAMLRALPAVEYFVTDPWMDGNTYGGVLLSTLLAYVGFPDGAEQIVLIASDEKEFVIKLVDALAYPIMLVMDAQGEALVESLGGPVKVAYPYDAYPGLEELYPPENWAWWVVAVRIDY